MILSGRSLRLFALIAAEGGETAATARTAWPPLAYQPPEPDIAELLDIEDEDLPHEGC